MLVESDLFSIRVAIDPKRQPRHQTVHHGLVELLKDNGISEPFSWGGGTKASIDAFRGNPLYARTCEGSPAHLESTGDQYCFRLVAMKKVVNFTNEGRLPKNQSEKQNWMEVHNDYLVSADWLELTAYVQGDLSGFRSFTWWTSSSFIGDPIRIAHQIGLVDEWIPYYALILRCPTAVIIEQALGYRPTIVDAFESPIFFATEDQLNPPVGLGIDLETSPLKADLSEFVCTPIPVRYLQCIPLAISLPPIDQCSFTMEKCLSPLHSFYSALR